MALLIWCAHTPTIISNSISSRLYRLLSSRNGTPIFTPRPKVNVLARTSPTTTAQNIHTWLRLALRACSSSATAARQMATHNIPRARSLVWRRTVLSTKVTHTRMRGMCGGRGLNAKSSRVMFAIGSVNAAAARSPTARHTSSIRRARAPACVRTLMCLCWCSRVAVQCAQI